MNNKFIEEVKQAVSGTWFKQIRKTKPKKINKTAEEICREELNK